MFTTALLFRVAFGDATNWERESLDDSMRCNVRASYYANRRLACAIFFVPETSLSQKI